MHLYKVNFFYSILRWKVAQCYLKTIELIQRRFLKILFKRKSAYVFTRLLNFMKIVEYFRIVYLRTIESTTWEIFKQKHIWFKKAERGHRMLSIQRQMN